MIAVSIEVRTDLPPPCPNRTRRRWDWENVPVGGSFEFEGVRPEAVIGSFGHHLAAGKYRVRALGDGRYRFWRLG